MSFLLQSRRQQQCKSSSSWQWPRKRHQQQYHRLHGRTWACAAKTNPSHCQSALRIGSGDCEYAPSGKSGARGPQMTAKAKQEVQVVAACSGEEAEARGRWFTYVIEPLTHSQSPRACAKKSLKKTERTDDDFDARVTLQAEDVCNQFIEMLRTCTASLSLLLALGLAGCGRDGRQMLSRELVQEATDFGLRMMNHLIEEQEPELYKRGLVLGLDHPGRYLAEFNGPSKEARRLAHYGYASLQATSRLVDRLKLLRQESLDITDGGLIGDEEEGSFRFSDLSLEETELHARCPWETNIRCPQGRRYRSHDGRCNNLNKPWWGAAQMPVRRFLPPRYADGVNRGRERDSGGSSLPSPRVVSIVVHADKDNPAPGVTHMAMQWGQFLDHDLTASAQSRGFEGSVPQCCADGGRGFLPPDMLHPDCMPIAIPPDDPFFGPRGIRCMEFVRSAPVARVGCILGHREQINQVTVYVDGSQIYGSSESESQMLRLGRGGLLRFRMVPGGLPLLAATASAPPGLCRAQNEPKHAECFASGDSRVNEQPGLASMHTVWLRAHNRIASGLAHLNPHWSDNRLYAEARRIAGAMMQHITYNEFLPLVLGPEVIRLFGLSLLRTGYYEGYDVRRNPTAANAFGTAAFRFGHSMVQGTLMRCDHTLRPLHANVSLHEELVSPADLYRPGGLDRLMLGMTVQSSQNRDEFMTEELTNRLFQTSPFGFGLDLASINIQRGRDHGLPPYILWREPCGLSSVNSWNDLNKIMTPASLDRLRRVYRNAEDIDLWSGGLAERPISGALVGPTFACILAQQFSNLRTGDRFWYENGGIESSFTQPQLRQLRRISLARVLCENLDGVTHIQPFVLLAADKEANQPVSCATDIIRFFDLSPWREIRQTPTTEPPPPSSTRFIADRPPQPPRPIESFSSSTLRPTRLPVQHKHPDDFRFQENFTKIQMQTPPTLPDKLATDNVHRHPTTANIDNNLFNYNNYNYQTNKPTTEGSIYNEIKTSTSPPDKGPYYFKPEMPATQSTTNYPDLVTFNYVESNKPESSYTKQESSTKKRPSYAEFTTTIRYPETPRPSYSNAETKIPIYSNSETLRPSYTRPEPTYLNPEPPRPSYTKPETQKHTYSTPETSKPTYSKPETARPTYSNSESSGPSYLKPVTQRPSYNKPETERPAYINSGTPKPSYLKPETDGPAYTNSETSRPSNTKPETLRPSYSNLQTEKPTYSNSDVSRPSYTRPETVRPTYSNPETSRPSYLKPETQRPSYSNPEIPRPSYTKPLTSKPSYSNSMTDRPTYSNSQTERPYYTNSKTPRPSYSNFQTQRPTYSNSQTERPDYTNSKTTRPSYTKPETLRPSYTQLETDRPELSRPIYAKPSTDLPSYLIPETLRQNNSNEDILRPTYTKLDTKPNLSKPNSPTYSNLDTQTSSPEIPRPSYSNIGISKPLYVKNELYTPTTTTENSIPIYTNRPNNLNPAYPNFEETNSNKPIYVHLETISPVDKIKPEHEDTNNSELKPSYIKPTNSENEWNIATWGTSHREKRSEPEYYIEKENPSKIENDKEEDIENWKGWHFLNDDLVDEDVAPTMPNLKSDISDSEELPKPLTPWDDEPILD